MMSVVLVSGGGGSEDTMMSVVLVSGGVVRTQ